MGKAYHKKPKPKAAGVLLYEEINAIAAMREQLRAACNEERTPSEKPRNAIKARLKKLNAEHTSLFGDTIEAFGLQGHEGRYKHLISTIQLLRDSLPFSHAVNERNLSLYSSKEKEYIARSISKTLDMLHAQLLEIEKIIDNDVLYYSHLLPTYIQMNPNGGSDPLGEIKHLRQAVKNCRSKIKRGNQKKSQRWFDDAMIAIASFWVSCGNKFTAEYNSDAAVISEAAAFSYCTMYVALPNESGQTNALIKEATKAAYDGLKTKAVRK